jgi:hypothetical protein
MNVSLKCRCGAVRGIATDIAPTTGIRVVCMCDDCQAYAQYLGKPNEILDEHGGTDIFQVTPSQLRITQGAAHIRVLRLTDKGLCRWYAGCCKTPIANSLNSAKVPFSGVVHTIMDHAGDGVTRDAALGPIQAKILGKFAIGKMPADADEAVSFGLVLRWMRFIAWGFIFGRAKPSPFFDVNTGKPIVAPYVLTKAERENLRRLCGPIATQVG